MFLPIHMKTHSPSELHILIQSLDGWQLKENHIVKTYSFPDFSAAFAFMTQIAALAEQENHHPDWSGTYNTVTLQLCTHDVGGITDKDLRFAEKADALKIN